MLECRWQINKQSKGGFFKGNGVWVENKGEAMSLYAQTFVGKLPYGLYNI